MGGSSMGDSPWEIPHRGLAHGGLIPHGESRMGKIPHGVFPMGNPSWGMPHQGYPMRFPMDDPSWGFPMGKPPMGTSPMGDPHWGIFKGNTSNPGAQAATKIVHGGSSTEDSPQS